MRRPSASRDQPQGGYELDGSHWLVQKGIVFYSPAPGIALSSKGLIPPKSHVMPVSPDQTMGLTVVGDTINYDTYTVNLAGSTPFTLIGWGKMVNLTNNHFICGIGIQGSTSHRAAISLDGSSDKPYVICADAGANDSVYSGAGRSYSANTWHMVTGVIGSATDLRCYLDWGYEGALTSGVNIPTSAMTTMHIGTAPNSSPVLLRNGDRVSGCMCVLGALTAEEVSRLYFEQLEYPYSLLLQKPGRHVPSGGTTVNSDHILNLDWLLKTSSDSVAPVEYRGALNADAQALVDFSSGVQTSASIPFDNSLAVRADHVTHCEWLAAVQADAVVPVEWSGGVLVNADAEIPVEWLGSVNVDGVMPVSFSQLLAVDQAIPVAFGAGVVSDQAAVLEWLASIGADALLPLSTIAVVQGDQVIMAEWSGTAAFVNGNLNIFHLDERGTVWRIDARGTVWNLDSRGTVWRATKH